MNYPIPKWIKGFLLMWFIALAGCLPNVEIANHNIEKYGGCYSDDMPIPKWVSFSTVPNPQIDDAAFARMMKWLKQLWGLEGLQMGGTSITDASLSRMATLTSLEDIQLTGTKVTPEGVLILARLKHLRQLELPDTFSNTDITRLHLAMPDVEIIQDSYPPHWMKVSTSKPTQLMPTRPNR